MSKFVVAAIDEMPPGTQRRVEVAGRGVAVYNIDGTFYALRDVCPHQGAELSMGTIVQAVSARKPGCYAYDAGRKLVRCPWHGWEFDLVTGQSWFDPARKRVKRYDVGVESGGALLSEACGPRTPGPYVVETISVSVENSYVVVTV